MTTEAASRGGAREASRGRTPGIIGWMLFDWAQQPFYTLVTTFLFSSYFANVFAGDKAQGFALWGYAMAAAGILVALISPALGAIADETGRLKRWIAGFSILFVAAQACLWFAAPGASWLVAPMLAAVVIAAVSAEFTTVFNNSMMTAVVSRESFGRLSGAGWAMGYLGGLASLVLITGFILPDGATQKTVLGFDVPFWLDTAQHHAERLIGPFSALWYVVFVLPLFLFTPDLPPKPVRFGQAARRGLSQLRVTLRSLPSMPDILRFLVARMLYIDGLLAIFTFGGIYASALFGWSTTQLGLFGILLTVTAAIGAVLGGFLDDRLGAKPVILGALVLMIAGLLGILSVDVNAAGEAAAAGWLPGFDATGAIRPAEAFYLACSALIGLAAGPLQASSRSLLARMVPQDRIAEFFGLYAFSGKITAFLAPLVIGAVADATGSQRFGIAMILVFLIGGFVLFLKVRAEPGTGPAVTPP